jgi:hypothetical protein
MLRLVELTEQQTREAQKVTGAPLVWDSRETLDQAFAFSEPVQCLGRIAEVRQDPSRAADRAGKREGYVTRPERCAGAFEQRGRLCPFALFAVENAPRVVGVANGRRVVRRFVEIDRLGLVLRRLDKSAEVGEALEEIGAIPSRQP